MNVSNDYLRWQKHAGDLLKPLEVLMQEGESEIPLSGAASDHDANADRLEAFARPCLLAAYWLASLSQHQDEAMVARADQTAKWFREALVQGSDPSNQKSYWGPNANYHQNGVEMGLLVIALEIAKEWLWEPLSGEDKKQIGWWIASNRGTGHHWNNHFFFGVFCLEFLESIGMSQSTDRQSIAHWMDEMELMYRGQGWFMDGMNQSYDHYNAYAFHFYAPMWIFLYGHRDLARVDRWKNWNRAFLDSYQHSFSAHGEHPPFGRSITYRFNAIAPFLSAQLIGTNPLDGGRSRRLCTRNLEFFLSKDIRQEQGAIGIGWTDEFPELAEPYSCAGSVYWCAKAFTALLIPAEDEFWTDSEQSLLSEGDDFAHVVEAAGIVFRSVEGDVEILNAGSEICAGNRDKFGAFKWGKLAYRTTFGFTIGNKDQYSPDLGLTFRDPRDGRCFGRHYTVPLEVSDHHYLCSYDLGDRELQANISVESYVSWKGPWIIQVHHYRTYQESHFMMGGYALPVGMNETDEVEETVHDKLVLASLDEKKVSMQLLRGGTALSIVGSRSPADERKHLGARYHRTPVAASTVAAFEDGYLVSIIGATKESAPLSEPWEVISGNAGAWALSHPQFGEWRLEHPFLPSIIDCDEV